MEYKKWAIRLIILVLSTLLLFGSSMYMMDPLLHYGNEEHSLLSYYEYSEMYSNPGIAKYYDYDAVMVGTSMIENTNVDQCDELFECNMVRLPYSGGTTFNMRTILDLCFKCNSNIKWVYWELDEFQLFSSASEPRYPLPEYLYRTDHKEDLSYLLNIDIFYHYAIKDIIHTIQGDSQNAERRGISFTGDFSKEAVLNDYERPEQSNKIIDFYDSEYKDLVDANLQNLIELAEKHENTEFKVFFVPFSILYWDTELRNGRFDANVDALKYTVKKLLQYKNIKIYFYHCEKEIITDLNNYKDYSHYGEWINKKIVEFIAEEKNVMTESNYEEMLESFRDYIYSIDIDKLLIK